MENGLVDTVGEGARETMERAVSGRTHSCIKWLAGGKPLYNTGSPVWGSVMSRGLGVWRGMKAQEARVSTGEC